MKCLLLGALLFLYRFVGGASPDVEEVTAADLGDIWTPDPLCPFPSDDVTYFSYEGDCTKYWECFHGKKYEYTCPAGLWWHEDIKVCDYPGTYCDGSTGTPSTSTSTSTSNPSDRTTPPGTPDPLCPYPSDTLTYFPYQGDCSRYWECYQGKKFEYVCPEGLWWHQSASTCDYPGDFCDRSDATTTLVISSTPNSNVDPRCRDIGIGYWPHPVTCNQYIECFEGNSYEMNCPSGLFFSSSQKECVISQDSECCTANRDVCV